VRMTAEARQVGRSRHDPHGHEPGRLAQLVRTPVLHAAGERAQQRHPHARAKSRAGGMVSLLDRRGFSQSRTTWPISGDVCPVRTLRRDAARSSRASRHARWLNRRLWFSTVPISARTDTERRTRHHPGGKTTAEVTA